MNKQWERAVEIFTNMEDSLKSIITYTAMINNLCKNNQPKLAMEYYEIGLKKNETEMRESGTNMTKKTIVEMIKFIFETNSFFLMFGFFLRCFGIDSRIIFGNR